PAVRSPLDKPQRQRAQSVHHLRIQRIRSRGEQRWERRCSLRRPRAVSAESQLLLHRQPGLLRIPTMKPRMTPTIPSSRNALMIRHVARATLLASALASLACTSADKFNVPQYNAPTITGVNGTAQALQLYVSGVLLQDRNNIGGYNNDVGIFGRESYS